MEGGPAVNTSVIFLETSDLVRNPIADLDAPREASGLQSARWVPRTHLHSCVPERVAPIAA